MRQLRRIAASLISAWMLSSIQAAVADNCEEGVRLYNAGQYAAAAPYFERCMGGIVRDPNYVYYAALNAQRLQQYDKARTWYESVASHFPRSQAGQMAAKALRNMGGLSGNVNPGETANLPRETYVQFQRTGNHMIVDVLINRQPTKMVFDTGADFTMLSTPIIQQLGMSIPNRPADGHAGGVGNKSYSSIWLVPVDINVGSVSRHNFRVGMSDAPQAVALLGRDFLKGMEYTVNDKDSSITFKRSDTGSGGKPAAVAAAPVSPEGNTTVTASGTYIYNVPFTTVHGGVIVIEAKINGNPCKMIFDTGASVCFFTPDQAVRFGVDVPANAQVVPIYGVSGNTTAQVCPIHSLKLGPLEGKEVICAIGKSVSPLPLLGQSFFKQYEYTIDHANKVIHFTKPKDQ
jgi:clan AA aspartic protease (TIGR02281 family)